jgi:hypothetical protein
MKYAVENYFSDDVCKTDTAGRYDKILAFPGLVKKSWKFRD